MLTFQQVYQACFVDAIRDYQSMVQYIDVKWLMSMLDKFLAQTTVNKTPSSINRQQLEMK